MDGKILAAARRRLNEARAEREREFLRRRREISAEHPEIFRLREHIAGTMARYIKQHLSGANAQSLGAIIEENLELQRGLEEELRKLGMPPNHLDDAPLCEKCGDSGFVNTRPCECLMALYKEELAKSLSSLLKLGTESFESFEPSFYDGEPDAQTGLSVRGYMTAVFEMCGAYADEFGEQSGNLFFSGEPGLGKTFLAACIARVVAARGFSVVYDTIPAIFARLEEEKFRRGEADDALLAQIRRYRECDLLIADDLGTEMQTSFTNAALYELVNTRLITGKKTIITSNLTAPELRARYAPPVASRLEGEYRFVSFYGNDIRKKRMDS
ncbi:MAG: ATP-binding protein [Oscillospiraceae bacterium]|jgi:DNA replication protein DnaC|nr:ATP-binding protein [Oscillospiraceae bacterium]